MKYNLDKYDYMKPFHSFHVELIVSLKYTSESIEALSPE